MAGKCCGGCAAPAEKQVDQAWRRALWIALVINASMFGVEIAAGVSAQSASLKADALDFLGDAANYAISLGVAGLALRWRARAALAKGVSLISLAAWVLGSTAGWRRGERFLPPRQWVWSVHSLLAPTSSVRSFSGVTGMAKQIADQYGYAHATTPSATSRSLQPPLVCSVPAMGGQTSLLR